MHLSALYFAAGIALKTSASVETCVTYFPLPTVNKLLMMMMKQDIETSGISDIS